jgi:hypothetical protein
MHELQNKGITNHQAYLADIGLSSLVTARNVSYDFHFGRVSVRMLHGRIITPTDLQGLVRLWGSSGL